MVVPPGVQRCPQCSYEGYCYDSVCRVWCCGRCYMMETEAEKGRREARSTRAGSTVVERRQGFSVSPDDRREPVAPAARRVA